MWEGIHQWLGTKGVITKEERQPSHKKDPSGWISDCSNYVRNIQEIFLLQDTMAIHFGNETEEEACCTL
jgi:hypothetical protein